MPNRKCGHFNIDEAKGRIIMVVVQRKEGNELMERMPAGGGEDAEVRGGAMVGSAVVGNGGKGTWELLKEGHVILAPLIPPH